MPTLNVHVLDEVFEDWGPQTVYLSEAEAIERAYGKSFSQFCIDIDAGSMYAMRVLAWSLLKRKETGLRLGDVDMSLSSIRLEIVDDPKPDATSNEEVAAADPLPDDAPSVQPSPSGDSVTSEPSPTTSVSDPGSGTA